MKDSKKEIGKEKETSDALSDQTEQANARRNFIKKYGALAAITPVAMTMTMHSKKALAFSCSECAP